LATRALVNKKFASGKIVVVNDRLRNKDKPELQMYYIQFHNFLSKFDNVTILVYKTVFIYISFISLLVVFKRKTKILGKKNQKTIIISNKQR
jgi:hypothetical protein